jgi:hypothetical protein
MNTSLLQALTPVLALDFPHKFYKNSTIYILPEKKTIENEANVKFDRLKSFHSEDTCIT